MKSTTCKNVIGVKIDPKIAFEKTIKTFFKDEIIKPEWHPIWSSVKEVKLGVPQS